MHKPDQGLHDPWHVTSHSVLCNAFEQLERETVTVDCGVSVVYQAPGSDCSQSLRFVFGARPDKAHVGQKTGNGCSQPDRNLLYWRGCE